VRRGRFFGAITPILVAGPSPAHDGPLTCRIDRIDCRNEAVRDSESVEALVTSQLDERKGIGDPASHACRSYTWINGQVRREYDRSCICTTRIVWWPAGFGSLHLLSFDHPASKPLVLLALSWNIRATPRIAALTSLPIGHTTRSRRANRLPVGVCGGRAPVGGVLLIARDWGLGVYGGINRLKGDAPR